MEWRLFADLADITGTRQLSRELPDSESNTVGDAISDLVEEHPALADRLYGEDEELYEHLNILKNGEDISNLEGLDTPVGVDDELAVFPPVSGG